MTFEGRRTAAIRVAIPYNINGLEVVKLKTLEAKRQLDRGGADKEWHRFVLLQVNVFKGFVFGKLKHALQESVAPFSGQTFIIRIVPGEETVIIVMPRC